MDEKKPSPTKPMMQSALRCLIPLKGGQNKVIQIPQSAPKVERENAWAMTNGYHKSVDLYHVSIFTAGENAVILKNGFADRGRFIPKVLSYKVTQENQYPVSECGLQMGVSDYDKPFLLPHKYVAILDRIFYIKKGFHDNRGMELWTNLCNNGIFDIWKPVAPFNRLIGDFDLERTGKKKIINRPQILLLRVYELDRTLTVEHRPTFTDAVTVTSNEIPLTLRRPMIPYDSNDGVFRDFRGKYTFSDIGDRIENTLEKFSALQDQVIINDTSKIEIAVSEHHQ
jgi:hypothetical protein